MSELTRSEYIDREFFETGRRPLELDPRHDVMDINLQQFSY